MPNVREPAEVVPPVDLSALSDREREILELAIAGATARDIAKRLSLTEATVRSHLSRIYAKTQVTGRIELMARLRQRERSTDRTEHATELRETAHRRLLRSVVLGLLVIVGLAAGLATTRPDLPPTADLPTLVRLVDAGEVRALDIGGDQLSASLANGTMLRINGIDRGQAEALQDRAFRAGLVQAVTAGGATDVTPIAMLMTSALPVVAAAVVVVAVGGLALRQRRA
jgi:DNA-binding CsgD family transcriptional regulator